MSGAALEGWLGRLEALNPDEIELGLERVREVLAGFGFERPAPAVVVIGGTNGKGSCVAYLEAILSAAGWSVGAYTSPHLVSFNERVRIAGHSAGDEALVSAFEHVEAARGSTRLTYFEFTTLAAFYLMHRAGVDVALLEVGLGGRLDAVNVIDGDVAIVTSVGIDHQAWLGPDRETIGREKAGIFRRGRPAVCGDPTPPASLLRCAGETGADLRRLGTHFDYRSFAATWDWWGDGSYLRDLPLPRVPGDVQLCNAACALEALRCLASRPVVAADVRRGLRDARLHGRVHIVPGTVEWILDVAHNPDAAAVLGRVLAARPTGGRTVALFGLLADKPVEEIARQVAPHVDHWIVAGLEGPRGLTASQAGERLREVVQVPVAEAGDIAGARLQAVAATQPGDRVVVFGSFRLVGPILEALQIYSDQASSA